MPASLSRAGSSLFFFYSPAPRDHPRVRSKTTSAPIGGSGGDDGGGGGGGEMAEWW